MKTTLVRAFVLTLTLAGFGATTSISKASVTTTVAPSVVGTPTPLCPLNDPNACGLD